MNRMKIPLSFLFSFFCLACNGFSSKDEVIARIGNSSIYNSEINFALGSMKGKADKESLVVSTIIDARIRSEIAQLLVPQASSKIQKSMAIGEDRDLSISYKQVYLFQNLGRTNDELNSWYLKNRGKYWPKRKDADFFDIKDSIALKYFLMDKEKDLRAYFEKNKKEFAELDSVEIGVLSAKDSGSLNSAASKLRSGISFDSVAVLFNADSVLQAKRGKIGVYSYGSIPSILLGVPNLKEWLFDRKTRVPKGTISPKFKLNSVTDNRKDNYYVIVPIRYADAKEPSWEKLRGKIEQAYVEDYRRNLINGTRQNLLSKYKVVIHNPPAPDLRKYYETVKNEYMTQPEMELLHIQGVDSLKLAQLVSKVKTEKEFRDLAAKYSTNSQTRKRSGSLGLIKEGHCLPAGIGMMPDLFSNFAQSGSSMSAIMPSRDNNQWNVFWRIRYVPSQIKPFERVKEALSARLASQDFLPVDSNFVHADLDGVAAVRERDVLFTREEIPKEEKPDYPREKLVDILVTWAIYSREARELGLEKSYEFKAMTALRKADLWAGVFRDSVVHGTLDYSTDTLLKVYESKKNSIFKDLSDNYKLSDAARWLAIPDWVYMRDFVERSDWYSKYSDWKSAKEYMFGFLRNNESVAIERRLIWKYIPKIGVEISSAKWRKYYPYTPEDVLASGLNYFNSRDLYNAKNAFQKVRDIAGIDTLSFRATYMMAQAFMEEENYAEAVIRYKSAYALWPSHPDAYKALFMQGFLYSEYLKQDSLSVPAFQELLQKFPKCDLADDADWMLKNIQSGGKLAPALLESLGGEAPVSQ